MVQWICFYGFGYNAHKKSVDVMNFFLLGCLKLLGTRISFDNPHLLQNNQSYIITANHQSMFDIPPLIWYLRKVHPKFISKKELGKGIPGVSFNLKHGGSVLIDRKNPKQALNAINRFATSLHSNGRSAVIFPEGTRSFDGRLKAFKHGAFTLAKRAKVAILPIVIEGTSEALPKRGFLLHGRHDIQIRILDANLSLLPIGSAGELCLLEAPRPPWWSRRGARAARTS